MLVLLLTLHYDDQESGLIEHQRIKDSHWVNIDMMYHTKAIVGSDN